MPYDLVPQDIVRIVLEEEGIDQSDPYAKRLLERAAVLDFEGLARFCNTHLERLNALGDFKYLLEPPN